MAYKGSAVVGELCISSIYDHGKYWAIVNLDTEAAYEMNKLGECIETLPLTKFFTRGYAIFSSDKLIERLHKDPPHYASSAAELRKVEKPIPAAAQQRDSPFFMKLSTELVDAIFAANADDFVTTVSLAVTCRQAWDIGAKRYFKLHLDAYYGSWNGNRMIILGDYACFDDLPEGIFTPKEQRFIDHELAVARKSKDAEDAMMSVYRRFVRDRCYTPPDPMWPVRQMFHEAMLEAEAERERAEASAYYPDRIDEYLEMRSQRARLEFKEPHRRRRRVFADDIFHAGVDLYSSPPISDKVPIKRLVLRNLTTKEYVRGAELAHDQACTPDRWYTDWSVGELLALRVCWSSDTSAGLPEEYEGNITRGPWAGHRFDIVLEEDLPCDAEGNVLPEWTDVSDDVLDDAWNLFSALYPKS